MGCPEPLELSKLCDGESLPAEARRLTAHLAGCSRCRERVEREQEVARAVAALTCPEAEVLARFVDDDLPAAAGERVAAHVLRCDACRDVVAWTKEGLAEQARRSGRGRRASGAHRRRAAAPRREPASPWLPVAVAAAAAVLLAVVLLRGEPVQPSGDRAARPTPAETSPTDGPEVATPASPSPAPTGAPRPGPSPSVEPTSSTAPSPTPSPTTAPTASPRPSVEPSASPEPSPTTEPRPSPSPRPTSTVSPTPAPSPAETPAPAGVAVAALDGAGLRWRDPAGREGVLAGGAVFPPGTRFSAPDGAGTFRTGVVACTVPPRATLAVHAPDGEDARLELVEGAALFESPRPGARIACGEAVVEPGPAGGRFAVERSGPGRVMVAVVSGSARAGTPAAMARVEAGRAARIERGEARPATGGELLERAREQGLQADLSRGLSARRGLAAARVLTELEDRLAAADPARRARAAYAALAAAAADPALASAAAPLADDAGDALAAVLAADDTALAEGGAAAPAALAVLARARRWGQRRLELPDADADRLEALAEALAAHPAAALAADTEVLLALRAVEKATGFRAPRALWGRVAEAAARPDAGPGALARLLLAGRGVDPAPLLADLDALLARSALDAPLEPATLLEVERSLTLASALDAPRLERVLAHAAGARSADPAALIVLARDAAPFAGRQPVAPGAPSVVAVPVDGGWRVTWVFRAERRPQGVHLVGSWDQWDEEATPMTRRPDGSFVHTRVLPPGRHEYKFILRPGGSWTTDAGNPLQAPSGVDATENSVLLLPE